MWLKGHFIFFGSMAFKFSLGGERWVISTFFHGLASKKGITSGYTIVLICSYFQDTLYERPYRFFLQLFIDFLVDLKL